MKVLVFGSGKVVPFRKKNQISNLEWHLNHALNNIPVARTSAALRNVNSFREAEGVIFRNSDREDKIFGRGSLRA